MKGRYKNFFKFMLWLLFFITFTSEFVKIVFELGPETGHKHLGMANAFFWSSLFLIEMIMGGLLVFYFIKFPARRLRLFSLAVCHFTIILILPMVLDNWSWTCVLYPWPHSLQVFDPATPKLAFVLSVITGFIIIPAITLRWGAKAFCGYMCPHGAFFSETYGRLFVPCYGRIKKAARIIPPVYFALMVMALLAIIAVPQSVVPLRTIQKLVYFSTAEFFFFVISIPLFGGRSYCVLFCPLGYFIRRMVTVKNRIQRVRR